VFFENVFLAARGERRVGFAEGLAQSFQPRPALSALFQMPLHLRLTGLGEAFEKVRRQQVAKMFFHATPLEYFWGHDPIPQESGSCPQKYVSPEIAPEISPPNYFPNVISAWHSKKPALVHMQRLF
jgi:hypothetical protein